MCKGILRTVLVNLILDGRSKKDRYASRRRSHFAALLVATRALLRVNNLSTVSFRDCYGVSVMSPNRTPTATVHHQIPLFFFFLNNLSNSSTFMQVQSRRGNTASRIKTMLKVADTSPFKHDTACWRQVKPECRDLLFVTFLGDYAVVSCAVRVIRSFVAFSRTKEVAKTTKGHGFTASSAI